MDGRDQATSIYNELFGFLVSLFSKIHECVTDCSFVRVRCGSGSEDKPSITSANMEQYSVTSVR